MTSGMKSIVVTFLFAAFFVAGCSTQGSSYAKSHPELSPLHRQILTTGEIMGGNAVDGMTKEQVELAMGSPTTLEKIDGQDAWIYVHPRFVDVRLRDNAGANFGSGADSHRKFAGNANRGLRT